MSDENKVESCIKDKSVWMRLLYMLLFTALYSVAEIVIFAVAVYQFLSVLFTGSKDEKILDLGKSLSAYAYQVLQFLMFNTEEKPFPMSDWPEAKVLQAEADKPKTTRKRSTTRKTTRKTTAKKTSTRKPAASKNETQEKSDDNKADTDESQA